MAVNFFVPDQYEAWRKLDKDLFAKRSQMGKAAIEQWWESGKLGIHEMATEEGPFGYLVLTTIDLGAGKWLQVLWCQVYPVKGLRHERGWLWDAARYLEQVALQYGCAKVKINVNENHPSQSWKRRLMGVGFAPEVTEMSLPARAEEKRWVA